MCSYEEKPYQRFLDSCAPSSASPGQKCPPSMTTRTRPSLNQTGAGFWLSLRFGMMLEAARSTHEIEAAQTAAQCRRPEWPWLATCARHPPHRVHLQGQPPEADATRPPSTAQCTSTGSSPTGQSCFGGQYPPPRPDKCDVMERAHLCFFFFSPVTYKVKSLCNAIAFGVQHCLHTFWKLATEALHIAVLVDVLAYPLPACPELFSHMRKPLLSRVRHHS